MIRPWSSFTLIGRDVVAYTCLLAKFTKASFLIDGYTGMVMVDWIACFCAIDS